jgi:Uma2 family endonuclease
MRGTNRGIEGRSHGIVSWRIQFAEDLTMPGWVQDLASFTRWIESDEFPEDGRIDYLAGEVWVDMCTEQVWSHNQVKTEFTVVLGTVAKQTGLGRFFQEGLRAEHPEAQLSVVPDGVFILKTTRETMRATMVERPKGGALRVAGSPDVVLEVLSDSSVRKDTAILRELYAKAGVPEYWLVDARKAPLTFEILRLTAKGYAATRKREGWLNSTVLGKACRLVQRTDELGDPTFALEVR